MKSRMSGWSTLRMTIFAAPPGDGIDHTADELAHRALAIGLADVAAEVLGDDHVGGHLRPELRHLDVLLLEHDRARLIRDHGRPELPLTRVVHVDAGLRVEAPDLDSPSPRLLAARLRRLGRRTGSKRLGHVDGRHGFLLPPDGKAPPSGALPSPNQISA